MLFFCLMIWNRYLIASSDHHIHFISFSKLVFVNKWGDGIVEKNNNKNKSPVPHHSTCKLMSLVSHWSEYVWRWGIFMGIWNTRICLEMRYLHGNMKYQSWNLIWGPCAHFCYQKSAVLEMRWSHGGLWTVNPIVLK